jgi:hypothetical protein
VAIIVEILYFSTSNIAPKLNPESDKNLTINNYTQLLQIALLTPIQMNIRDYENEIEFFLKSTSGNIFKVILSTSNNSIEQVSALQKLIKIANIKGKDINFIDLSSTRPYATL